MTIVRTQKETERHLEVENLLSPYFTMFHDETYGKHWSGEWVKPDFLIFPKQPLIDAGVPDRVFGIEIKTSKLLDGSKKQAIELIAQAISYQEAEFKTSKGLQYLEATFVFPDIKTYAKDSSNEYSDDFKDGITYGLSRLAGRFGVGEIIVTDWGLEFLIAKAVYLRISNNGEVSKGRVPLGGKIQIGCDLKYRNKLPFSDPM